MLTYKAIISNGFVFIAYYSCHILIRYGYCQKKKLFYYRGIVVDHREIFLYTN